MEIKEMTRSELTEELQHVLRTIECNPLGENLGGPTLAVLRPNGEHFYVAGLANEDGQMTVHTSSEKDDYTFTPAELLDDLSTLSHKSEVVKLSCGPGISHVVGIGGKGGSVIILTTAEEWNRD